MENSCFPLPVPLGIGPFSNEFSFQQLSKRSYQEVTVSAACMIACIVQTLLTPLL